MPAGDQPHRQPQAKGEGGVSKARAQKTRIEFNGEDVTNHVMAATLRRAGPDDVETVTLEIFVDELEVEPDGTLVIRIDTT